MYVRVGQLIDGNGGLPQPDAVIEVADGRIAAIARAEDFGARLRNGPVLDFGDAFALPGLIDCHAHLTLPSDGRSIEAQLSDPPELQALTAQRQLTVHLRSGVTTIRDCGAYGQTMFHVREAARRGYFPSPRLQLAGRPITHSGGHMHNLGGVADGPDEIRRLVRILVSEGADVIKVIAAGGATRGTFRHLPSYSADELRIAVEMAHALERPTVAHARSAKSIENCIDAGLDAIAHLDFFTLPPGMVEDTSGTITPTGVPCIDMRVAEKLAASSVWLDLNPQSTGWDTVVRLRAKAAHETLTAAEAGHLSKLERYFDQLLEVYACFLELGLADRMAFGTDAGGFAWQFGHLDYNVHLARKAGLTPMQSLQAVTRNAARLCGLDNLIGTLEPGKQADLLIVEADPLVDAHNLTRVAAVFQAGERVV